MFGVFLCLCNKVTRNLGAWTLASTQLCDVTFGKLLTALGHACLIEVLVPEIVIVPFPHASQSFF